MEIGIESRNYPMIKITGSNNVSLAKQADTILR